MIDLTEEMRDEIILFALGELLDNLKDLDYENLRMMTIFKDLEDEEIEELITLTIQTQSEV
jgi:recombinational DNA repair protein RecR